MFDKILVANRGEVALRIMRAARELGVKTVAVYSTADKDTLPVRYADEAVCIGPAPAGKSYLNMANIIAAATTTGCQAVHPGYGFLAENSDFARACADNDLVFIGPAPECIDRMGDKAAARETMMACGVPTVPGSDGVVESVEDAREFAERVGYPVLIKASAGGGGKGMREVHAPEDLADAFMAAKAEAKAAFANDDVYIEKLVLHPRHVEIQILADDFGHQIALCERDCSIQRRHQKLLEEAPSPALDERLRRDMAVAAVKAVRAVDYRNAGTIEFLLDNDGKFYFMEMNTRVQVEHPVTEQITGVDIIKEQLRIASGEPMSCAGDAPFAPNGHAIECSRVRSSRRSTTPWWRSSSCGVATATRRWRVAAVRLPSSISKALRRPFRSTRPCSTKKSSSAAKPIPTSSKLRGCRSNKTSGQRAAPLAHFARRSPFGGRLFVCATWHLVLRCTGV